MTGEKAETNWLGLTTEQTAEVGNYVQLVTGGISAAIGSYHAAVSNRYALRSDALNYEFQGSMADVSARQAEWDAQAALEIGQQRKAHVTARFGQASAQQRARTGGAGVQHGVGSTGEVQASIAAVKEIESATIGRNALREASRSRMRAVALRNRADLARVSAQGARDMANAYSPGLALTSSLLGSASSVAATYLAGIQ